jgi:hypothetical protein
MAKVLNPIGLGCCQAGPISSKDFLSSHILGSMVADARVRGRGVRFEPPMSG